MTEDEAKTKWCPFARALIFDNTTSPLAMSGGVNRVIGKHVTNKEAAPVNCLASACMAWRREKVPNPDWNPDSNQMAGWPPRNPYASEPSFVFSKTDGHCGLAGQA